VETVNQGGATIWASGLAPGSGSVTVALNGSTNSGVLFDPRSNDGRWRVPLVVPTGTNKIVATGALPISGTTLSATNTFIVLAQDVSTDSYDGAGNLITRAMTGSRTQTLKWDALGRLVNVQQVDTGGNGYNFACTYDGLGRRIRTVYSVLTNSVVVSGTTVTTDSYFDPQVEFLELGVSVNGQRWWKVFGPDLSGGYGAQQGIGGLESVIRESDGTVTAFITDAFGNTLGTTAGLNQVTWTSMRVSGFGPVFGYQVPILSPSTSVGETALWLGKRIDPTGYYHFGVRYEDPVAGRFISTDPMGHGASLSLYDYCGNNPFNRFDPDGRVAKAKFAMDYNGFGLPQTLSEFGDYLNSYSTDNSLVGSAAAFVGSLSSTLGGMLTPRSYGDSAQHFAGTVNNIYQEDGFVTAASYATTSWNVGAVYEGVANMDLATGEEVGSWDQRGGRIASGVGNTAGLLSAGMWGVGKLGLLEPPAPPELLRVEPYDELRADPDATGQAHHLNQNAVYRDVIPKGEGMSIELEGNAFTDAGSPHYNAHASLETFWDQFRPEGARFGETPTNLEYTRALQESLRSAGLSETQVQQAVRAAIRQRVD
ncbi:MAG TPA: RHS repeat-associated core domain-containing protein, partial [Verrucomicrobiae bacterium]